jgi:site-specific DNA-methyltransferase (adenine-specific)
MNRLFFGDNLGWLRDPKEFPDETVDLVYLDPPFNSNADYNVLFREASGEASQAQFHVFNDTWSWADSAAHAAQSAKRKKVAGSNCAVAKANAGIRAEFKLPPDRALK